MRPFIKQKTIPVAVLAIFIILGGVYLLRSHAATPYVTAEPDMGTISGTAAVVSDTTASGLKAIKFGASTTPTPTPSPTPTPTPGGNTCAPYPSFPDASCTGPTGTLTTYTGSQTFSTPGQVIENVIINTTGLSIEADNVTFKNCKIIMSGGVDEGYGLVYLTDGATGTTFDHCELDGKDRTPRAIRGFADVTVRNSNIHHTGNGIEVGTKIKMYDSYMHDIKTPSGLDWHADGIQAGDSGEDIDITHNTILLTGGETGAIAIMSNGGVGTFKNVLIQNNLMAGGGYTVYAGSAPARTINFKVINNHFTTRYYPKVGQFNIWYETFTSNVVRSGNVIHETGAAANSN